MSDKNIKYVIVTGGSKGLGLAIVKALADDGYYVIAASRTRTESIDKLIQDGGSISFEELDLKNSEEIHGWVKRIIGRYGVPYALINNAAIAHDGVLGTMHESQIEEVLRVNVFSAILLTKYISRAMLVRRRGRIVNISSIIASTGYNGLSVYAASKAALNGFTKSLARELGRLNITVNSIAPGYMETDMSSGLDEMQLEQIQRRSALRRLAKTDEVASAVQYLISEKASAITGTIITIDAGNTA
ncbi:SDR family NAD(P)-dependent oxidoreductase [Comamonas aquatica]|uniref:SDR family NAD(P)-dependent oxidoreductase n=1 Tax=Comamonas aquatica TaxID=225991 RepID=UPI0021B0A988|nr:SDR family NAD(P)-dependent oxidoreductase [Comamonas aquatica]